jgi:5'-3' exonuclease
MGVLRFFYWVLNNMPKNVCHFVRKNWRNQGKFRPDIFLIDLNAIIHPCFHDVFHPEKLADVWRGASSTETHEEKIERAIQLLCSRVDAMITLVNPTKCVYIGVDGVAGCCKQSQQRKRRFKAAKDRAANNDTSFNTVELTAGTPLLQRLCEAVEKYFTENKREGLTVVINPVTVAGEGEHKLIQAMVNQKKYKSFTIFSPDADLIMLAMVTGLPRIQILRENIYDSISGDWIFVDIDRLKSVLTEKITLQLLEEAPCDLNWDNVIRDVVLFMFMLGNDFLPNVPSIEIAHEGIDTLLHVYSKIVGSNGYLVGPDNRFNLRGIRALFKEMGSLEPEMLLKKYLKNKAKWPDTVLQSNISREAGFPQINFANYSEAYYARNFSASREEICEEYMRGMSFVMKYYTKGIPTYDYSFEFHYAPLFNDLNNWVHSVDHLDFQFKFQKPLTLVESLVSVLPPSAFYLLPEPVQTFMKERAEIDGDWSENFEIDLEGKQQDYEAVLLLPTVPYDKVKRLLKGFKLKDHEGHLVVIN